MFGWMYLVGLDLRERRRLAGENGDAVVVDDIFVVVVVVVVAVLVVVTVVLDFVVLVVVVVFGAGNPDCVKKGCPEPSTVFSRLMLT